MDSACLARYVLPLNENDAHLMSVAAAQGLASVQDIVVPGVAGAAPTTIRQRTASPGFALTRKTVTGHAFSALVRMWAIKQLLMHCADAKITRIYDVFPSHRMLAIFETLYATRAVQPPPGTVPLTYYPVMGQVKDDTSRDAQRLVKLTKLSEDLRACPEVRIRQAGGAVLGPIRADLVLGLPNLDHVFATAIPDGPSAIVLVDVYHLTADAILKYLDECELFARQEREFLLQGDIPSTFALFWVGHVLTGEFGLINDDVFWKRVGNQILVPQQSGLPESYAHPDMEWLFDPRLSVAVVKKVPLAAQNGMMVLQLSRRRANDVPFPRPVAFAEKVALPAGFRSRLQPYGQLAQWFGTWCDRLYMSTVVRTHVINREIAARVTGSFLQRTPNSALTTAIQQAVNDRLAQVSGASVLMTYGPDEFAALSADTALYAVAGGPAVDAINQFAIVPTETWQIWNRLKHLRAAVGERVPTNTRDPIVLGRLLLKVVATTSVVMWGVWRLGLAPLLVSTFVKMTKQLIRLLVRVLTGVQLTSSSGETLPVVAQTGTSIVSPASVLTYDALCASLKAWRRLCLTAVLAAPICEELFKHAPGVGWFFRRLIWFAEFSQDLTLLTVNGKNHLLWCVMLSVCWRSLHMMTTGSLWKDILVHASVNAVSMSIGLMGTVVMLAQSAPDIENFRLALRLLLPDWTDVHYMATYYIRWLYVDWRRLVWCDSPEDAVLALEKLPKWLLPMGWLRRLPLVAFLAICCYGLYCLWTPSPKMHAQNRHTALPLSSSDNPALAVASHIPDEPDVASPFAGLSASEVLALVQNRNSPGPSEPVTPPPNPNPVVPADPVPAGLAPDPMVVGKAFSENQLGPWLDRIPDWSSQVTSGAYPILPYRHKQGLSHTVYPPLRDPKEFQLVTHGLPASLFEALGQYRTATKALLSLPICPGVWFSRPASTVSNSICMARARLLAEAPGIPPLIKRHLEVVEQAYFACEVHQGLTDLYDWGVRQLSTPDPIVVTEEMEDKWLTAFSGAKWKRNAQALKDIRERYFRLSDKGCKTITLFAKTDETLFRLENGLPAQRPRVISQLDPRCQAFLGPAVHEVAERLAQLWDYEGRAFITTVPNRHGNHVPNWFLINFQITYAYRPTAAKLTKWMQRVLGDVQACSRAYDYVIRIIVAGDDHLALIKTPRATFWLEGDVSMCDQSQTYDTIGRDVRRYVQLGLPQVYGGIIHQLCKAPMKLDLGKHKLQMRFTIIPHCGTKLTGGPDTACGTSIAVGESLSISLIRLIDLGMHINASNVAAEMLRFGFKLKIKEFVHSTGPLFVTFLKGWWVPVVEEELIYIWTPLPSRLLKVGIADGDVQAKYTKQLEMGGFPSDLGYCLRYHLRSVACGFGETFLPTPLYEFAQAWSVPPAAPVELDKYQVQYDRPSKGVLADGYSAMIYQRYGLTMNDLYQVGQLYAEAEPPQLIVHPALAKFASVDYA